MKKLSFILFFFGFFLNSAISQVIKTIEHSQQQPLTVYTKLGMPTVVQFNLAANEVVEIAISGIGNWKDYFEIEKASNGRVIFKPLQAGAEIKCVILGGSFNYTLIVKTISSNDYYSFLKVEDLDFNTSQLKKSQQEMQSKLAAEERQKEIERSNARLAKANDLLKLTRPQNYSYSIENFSDGKFLLPRYIYDDGLKTYLGFYDNQRIPAVYQWDALTKTESIVNFRYDEIKREMIIDKVMEGLILRLEDKGIALYNDRPTKFVNRFDVRSNEPAYTMEKK